MRCNEKNCCFPSSYAFISILVPVLTVISIFIDCEKLDVQTEIVNYRTMVLFEDICLLWIKVVLILKFQITAG